ncbi:Ubiquilin-3 [Conglomerata obtusa]
MLLISYENNTFEYDYKPTITISEFKRELSQLLDIPFPKLQILYNNVQLQGESEPLSFFFPDDSTITILELADKKGSAFAGLFGNEESVNSLMKMFPDLKKNVKDNKQLKEMIQSGYLEEEMDKMMSNPAYMKEQMKNADRAMSKLENIPGGMDMMNSMIKDVRDPLDNMFKKKGEQFKEGENRKEVISDPIVVQQNKPNHLLLYVQQLSELRVYGFKDVSKNVEALIICNGDVEAAIEILANQN